SCRRLSFSIAGTPTPPEAARSVVNTPVRRSISALAFSSCCSHFSRFASWYFFLRSKYADSLALRLSTRRCATCVCIGHRKAADRALPHLSPRDSTQATQVSPHLSLGVSVTRIANWWWLSI